MTVRLDEYQAWTETKWNGHGFNCTAFDQNTAEQLCNALIGDYGEGGELADILKKLLFHGASLDGETAAKLAKELGDRIFYWARLADLLGFDGEAILRMNMRKLNARYPNGFDTERSNNRDESREG